MRERVCTNCGAVFVAGPSVHHVKRCPTCREINRKERDARLRRDPNVPRSSVLNGSIAKRRPNAELRELAAAAELIAAELHEHAHTPRPATRGECLGADRPCPWVGCRYHMAIDVDPRSGTIKVVHPTRDVDELKATCALDVADESAEEGGVTLEAVGGLLNVTRERARQIETKGLIQLAAALRPHQGDR